MTPEKLALLNDHYKNSVESAQSRRQTRDRLLMALVALIALLLFDVGAPQDFDNAAADILRAQLQLSRAPDLSYIRSLLWFGLLAVTVRYFQSVIGLEREYDYLHDIEKLFEAHFDPPAFQREGKAYLRDYPPFLKWADRLYKIGVPSMIGVVTIAWTLRRITSAEPLRPLLALDLLIAVAIVVAIGMYLPLVFKKKKDTEPTAQ
jgi:hypothetical protein